MQVKRMLVLTATASIFIVAIAGSAQAQQNCDTNGETAPLPINTNGQTWNIQGGQINFAGATLFVDFFRARASTNDATPADYDNDGEFGFAPPPFGFPGSGNFVDQLAETYIINNGLDTWWNFTYRSVGSVEGFGEFVTSELCNEVPDNVPSEAGIFNGFEYSTGDTVNWAGPFANSSGIPLEQCKIDGGLTDTPASWAVVVDGEPKWNRNPTSNGYGLNFIETSTGTVPQLQFLERACTTDILDLDVGNPTPGQTIFDVGVAWGPVVPIANRGTGVKNIKYSQLQYHNVTGRLPNGMNLISVTRDVGSGTHNAFDNSLNIDPSWGRGDNVGDRTDNSSTDRLGPIFQQSNKAGSSRVEGATQNHRLALGYTGLGGPSRAGQDAFLGFYEVCNVCKDVDENGNPLVDCDVAHACPASSNGMDTVAAPNGGYLRPTIGTVIDNCDPACGYTIGAVISFSVVGDPNANRPDGDPKQTANPQVVNQAAADYLNNIVDSIDAFSGDVFGGSCLVAGLCSTTGFACDITTTGTCGGGAFDVCEPVSCSDDADCTVLGVDPNDICALNANSPGQFLATTFFLTAALDCAQRINNPMVFEPNAALNQALQDFTRVENGLGWFSDLFNTVPGDTPAFGSISIAGFTPRRLSSANYTDGQGADAASVSYVYWDANAGIYKTVGFGNHLAKRNQLTGDFNNDGVRDINDATELVRAMYTPRAWQQTAVAQGTAGFRGALGPCPELAAPEVAALGQPAGFCLGDTEVNGGVVIRAGMDADNAIPEVIGDFDGDGNLSKEDLRYFMDGLATSNGLLDRRAGAIAIDEAIKLLGRPRPWADSNGLGVSGNTTGFALEPIFSVPASTVGFLATGAVYANGDFRGDVAGATLADDGRRPTAGAKPMGWDGRVDDKDIDYCCQFVREGYDWSNIDDAVFTDLSCDMNGDLSVDSDDIVELVEVILKTEFGDANLDGVVNMADKTIVLNSINDPNPCNADGSCGWADGDFNCDGVVDATDLAFVRLLGDFDGDGDVDQIDYASFAECMFGPNVTPTPGGGLTTQDCLDAFDSELDGDVDLDDAAMFQANFTGP